MVEVLAHQLQAKMRVGRIEVEPAVIELLDRFLQFATSRLAATALVVLRRWFDHSLLRPHLSRATDARPRNSNADATTPLGGGTNRNKPQSQWNPPPHRSCQIAMTKRHDIWAYGNRCRASFAWSPFKPNYRSMEEAPVKASPPSGAIPRKIFGSRTTRRPR